MRHPRPYVKTAQQRFAFQKNTNAPLWSCYSGGFYLLDANGAFVSRHPHLNRQHHFLPHCRSPGSRAT